MDNTVLIALTRTVVHTHALQTLMNAPPEQIQTTARNKLFALHVQRIMKVSVAPQLQTAQLFASLTKKNVKHPEQMIMDAHSLLFVLFKSVITTENFAKYIAPVYAMMIKYYAQEEEMKTVVKNHPSANHYQENYGERM